VRYSTAEGLSSTLLTSITEDRQGIIYIAGARGLDALDPETGRVRHFDVADGLASGDVMASICDRNGTLWFGAKNGLSRLMPGLAQVSGPPAVRITQVRVTGIPRALSGLGEQSVSGLRLEPAENYLDIE